MNPQQRIQRLEYLEKICTGSKCLPTVILLKDDCSVFFAGKKVTAFSVFENVKFSERIKENLEPNVSSHCGLILLVLKFCWWLEDKRIGLGYFAFVLGMFYICSCVVSNCKAFP